MKFINETFNSKEKVHKAKLNIRTEQSNSNPKQTFKATRIKMFKVTEQFFVSGQINPETVMHLKDENFTILSAIAQTMKNLISQLRNQSKTFVIITT
ncbi:MAG: hypothetical protein CM15mP12_5490 [Gammaproteobacteria bacterium]|nr:MAG: hypothetical protein CM15mP12_5490 [Gammaproteobacteria bacterium]